MQPDLGFGQPTLASVWGWQKAVGLGLPRARIAGF